MYMQCTENEVGISHMAVQWEVKYQFQWSIFTQCCYYTSERLEISKLGTNTVKYSICILWILPMSIQKMAQHNFMQVH
jgi:hypothetical protein